MAKRLIDAYKLEETLRNIVPPLYSNDYGQGFCDGVLVAVGVVMNSDTEKWEATEDGGENRENHF